MATGISFDGQKSVKGSEEDFHIVCLPCHRDGDTIAAFGYCCHCQEHLCAGCFRYHKKPRPFKHHILLDKDDMPDTQDLEAIVQPSPSDNLTTPCPHHKNEMLKIYCHDHQLLLCSICAALDHSKPCRVAYIPDISERIINSQEYDSVVERMDKVLTECASIKDNISEDANNSNSSMNDGLEDMRRLRQKIIDKFDKMEEDIENKIQALKQQNGDRKEEDESICNDVIKRLTILSDSMKQLNASKQADLLFVELKQSLNQLQEYEDSIRLLSTKSPIRTYKFVPSSMISDILQSEESWGDLTAIHKQHEASTSDQQPDQSREQTKPANYQDQAASTSTQQQQRTSTADQHPDQSKPTNCHAQFVSTSTQPQKQRTSTLDQQQGHAINETNPNNNRKQATNSSDEQQQSEIVAQPTPTNQQAQPTNYHVQAASTSSQQQDKTKDQIKPKSKGPDAASSSDQQQDQTSSKSQKAEQIQTPSQDHAGDQIQPISQQAQVYNKSNQKQGLARAQIQSTSAQYNPISIPAFDNIQATYQGELNVKTSEDWHTCSITGMTTLPSGKLVLVDNGNCAIKLLDINTDQIISRLSYNRPMFSINLLGFDQSPRSPWSPWTITATSSTQVAVTVPNEQEIQFITATDKLSFSHKVKTNGKCYGICYRENSLVVTYYYPGKLEIMNMQGKLMTSVQKHSTGGDILSRPNYVQANSNYIYVSDYNMGQVTMLNWQGEVTGKIGGLGDPTGLTLLHDGSLLVCGRRFIGGTVYHVSGDGTNQRAVLHGVSWPQAICVDFGGHTLYISRLNSSLSTGVNNSILVYKL